MRKHFDRTIGGEGKLIKRSKAERERKKSDFWGYDWNKLYIGYCDGASFGGMMMMGILFSRSTYKSHQVPRNSSRRDGLANKQVD